MDHRQWSRDGAYRHSGTLPCGKGYYAKLPEQESGEVFKLTDNTDALGWDSFVEGRIACEWGRVVQAELRKHVGWFDEKAWGAKLIDKLLQLTHWQWILWNKGIHFSLPDGWSLAQHEKILNNALTL